MESVRQATQQLRANKLRSFLSLLGITIGIFCIIGVLSAVDSLEANLRGSMEKLGNDVLYVQKWPWADVSDEWWEYFRRPQPVYAEYERIRERVNTAELTAYLAGIGRRTLKWRSNSVDGVDLVAASIEFDRVFNIDFAKGRFLSPAEYHYGSNKIVLGATVASELFGSVEPLGKTIKLMGRSYEVIGIIAPAGDDLLTVLNFDDSAILAYPNAGNLINFRNRAFYEATLAVKARSGVDIEQVKGEIRSVVRAQRRIKPRADDDFAINEISMVSKAFDSFFGVLNVIGLFIGGFSILVGGVSVANIMFVSVKERTSLIGVKKALGAKRYVILLEFLIEAIILCLVGGLIGLLVIIVATKLISMVIPFSIYLNVGNTLLGLVLSVVIGVVAGFIPALQAARMDPVEAMRH